MCERICTLPHADALLKGAEAECKSFKDEFKRRGLTEVAGQSFTVIAAGANCRAAHRLVLRGVFLDVAKVNAAFRTCENFVLIPLGQAHKLFPRSNWDRPPKVS